MESGDMERMRTAIDSLTQASNRLSEAAYRTASTATPQDGQTTVEEPAGAATGSGDVIDAEYETK
jgi:hypothetical protein